MLHSSYHVNQNLAGYIVEQQVLQRGSRIRKTNDQMKIDLGSPSTR